MGKTFRRTNNNTTPRGGLAARVQRLETMLFEANAYIVWLVNHKDEELDSHDTDFLEAAEEFRKSISSDARTLMLKAVRNAAE